MPRRWLYLVIGLAGLAPLPTAADPSPEWQLCAGSDTRPDEGIAACSVIIAAQRESGRNLAIAYFDRGNGWFAKREPDHAIDDFDQAIRFDPGNSRAHYNRGVALAALHDLGGAIAAFDQAIRLDPAFACQGLRHPRPHLCEARPPRPGHRGLQEGAGAQSEPQGFGRRPATARIRTLMLVA